MTTERMKFHIAELGIDSEIERVDPRRTPLELSGVQAVNTVRLPFAASIATDAKLGSHFAVQLSDDCAIANPANPIEGQWLTYELEQGGAGGWEVTWDTEFAWGTDVTEPVLSIAPGKVDIVSFRRIGGRWLGLAYARGY